MPGVSYNQKSSAKNKRCSALVMPGSLPVLADFLPIMPLIKVDFPTLGMPQINTRKGLSKPPRCGIIWRQARVILAVALASDASNAKACVCSRLLNSLSHRVVRSGSAKSCLLRIFSFGLPRESCASKGFSLEAGKRASSISITISMLLMRSAMAFFALFMCPGNH